ncbi:VUT family protein [Amycolatopsis sp. NPDC058278]|uniref:VUT family protein n=1 Tax=Amycolatopsis sp. NPDC058278 TaxID=3346417 RepID=UPI0036D75E30
MTTARPDTVTDHLRDPAAAVRRGRSAAALGYVGVILTTNVAATTGATLDLALLTIPVGAVCAGAVLEIQDHVHEAFGPRGVAAAIGCGTGLPWLLGSPAATTASALAFLLSETIDAYIYARLMRRRSQALAMMGSNAAGLVVDSVVFVPLAFGTWAPLTGQVVSKAFATAIAVGVQAVARATRQRLVAR